MGVAFYLLHQVNCIFRATRSINYSCGVLIGGRWCLPVAIPPSTIPQLLNAVRMVWVISRHYNTDEKMVPLMERIAHEIGMSVSQEINIKTIFIVKISKMSNLIIQSTMLREKLTERQRSKISR